MTEGRPRIVSVGVAVISALVVAVAPIAGLSAAGQYALATMAFAAVLWITGGLPLPLTALLVPVLLTVFGVYRDMADAVAGFADPVIFLLLAGFVLAEALQARDIDRRIALSLLARVGSSPSRLVLAVMVASALLSMVVSNTATVAMLVPVVIGLVTEVTGTFADDPAEGSNLRIASLLGIAYAASLGGVGTLIGTPPNAIVVGQLRELRGVRISFLDWLAVGLPMVAVTLPVAWLLLVRVYPPEAVEVADARRHARRQVDELGPLDARDRRVLAVFGATAALWVLGGLGSLLQEYLPSAVYVALFGGEATSVFGTTGHQGLLYYVLVGMLAIPALVLSGGADWDELIDVDWETLILLGGGISLANALRDTDAITWLADVTVGALAGASLPLVLLAVATLIVAVGELASNTAMAAVLAPLLIAIAPEYADAMGVTSTTASTFFAVAGAIVASYGFALPVATPPNAIVFGSGEVTRSQMLRAGILLDVVVILLATGTIWVLMWTLWPVVLG